MFGDCGKNLECLVIRMYADSNEMTDDGRFIVQGYKLTSDQARAQLVNFPDGEDAVIITKGLADLIVAHHTGTTA